MSLRNNTIATYASTGYVALINIAVLPLYIDYMGPEAFGLIGFFTMIQVWFTLLDVGLSPLMIRQTALFRGGAITVDELRRILRSLEGVFACISILAIFTFFLSSEFISSTWLNVQELSVQEINNSVSLIGLVVGLRWVGVLYKGVISGFEHLVWLGAFNSIIATLRFVLVLPVLIYFGPTPSVFFSYQLAIALIELVVLIIYTYWFLPSILSKEYVAWSLKPLLKNLKFSAGLTFSNITWIFFSQTDKLLLSSLLSLIDYGYFMLGVLLASSVMVISSPIANVLLPRLSKLHGEGDNSTLLDLYQDSTQLVAVMAIPLAFTLAFCAKQILWAWTGNMELAQTASQVLVFYSLGNCVMAITAFPYYLQFAKGDLKLHIIGSAMFTTLMLPLVFWSANTYGLNGPAYVWLAIHLLSFLFWSPIIHRRFFKSLHLSWLKGILPIIITPLFIIFIIDLILVWPEERIMVSLTVALIFILLFIASVLSSSAQRSSIKRLIISRISN